MSLHYETAGQGPPVLLIQGVGVAGCAWAPQVEALQDRFTLAWLDNPGIGRSEGPAGGLDRMAEAALEVLDALSWPAAQVAGHSLGGLVAQRLALAHPERVQSLALLSSFARGSATLSFSPLDLALQLRMVLGGQASRRRAFFEFTSAEEPTEENMADELEAAFGRSLSALPPAAFRQVWTLLTTDHRSVLPRLQLPALVIGGTLDRAAPPAQSRLLAQLLGCPLHLFESGHALPVERPAEVNSLLGDFWTRSLASGERNTE